MTVKNRQRKANLSEESISMNAGYRSLREGVKHSPFSLNVLPNKLKSIAENMMPYSVGIEIEARLNSQIGMSLGDWDNYLKRKIPSLMDIYFRSAETSFRIPKGISGMQTLYLMLDEFKTHWGLNNQSGIHYHIDCTEFKNEVTGQLSQKFINFVLQQKWVLNALDSWKYKGSYNKRDIGMCKEYWVYPRRSFCTLEFRIGEMSFDYSLIIKRILHLQNIVRKLKADYMRTNYTDETL